MNAVRRIVNVCKAVRACSNSALPTAVVCFAVLVGCGDSMQRPSRNDTVSPNSPSVRRLGTEHFSIEKPDEWHIGFADERKTKVFLVALRDEEVDQPRGIIRVDVGLPVADDARTTADAFASSFPEVSSVTESALDGVAGYEVEIQKQGLTQPQRVMVVTRNGRVFLLMAASDGSVDAVTPYEQVKHSWKWK